VEIADRPLGASSPLPWIFSPKPCSDIGVGVAG
jgi:hypothetical protein